MKKLEKIKLTQLSTTDLNEREMGILLGGSCGCACGCNYQGQPGGSTTSDNSAANSSSNLYSPGYGGGGGGGDGSNSSGPGCGSMYINTHWSCDQPIDCNVHADQPNYCS